MSSELKRAKWVLSEYRAPGEHFLCAVSGGLDSMCLLHFLHTWGREHGFLISAAHFNHGLRKTAARDEDFVRDICRQWGIPLATGHGDVQSLSEEEGLSIEEAGRILRYDFLRRSAKELGCEEILTAHHMGDQAETVLLNLIRGTGIKGLTGIPTSREGIFRPFLDVTREELEAYAAAHQIPHVEDESNFDPDAADRNLLRLQILPLLKRLNPRAVEHIGKTAGQLWEINYMLDEEAQRYAVRAERFKRRVEFPVTFEEWNAIPSPVRPRVLLLLFDRLGMGRRDICSVHLEALEKLICKGSGWADLPGDNSARYVSGRLILETFPEPLPRRVLTLNQMLRWGEYTLTLLDHPEGEGLALRLPSVQEGGVIAVAPCVPGARLTLPGTSGARTVKRLCLDRRIGLRERERLPAIYVDGRLAAVWRVGVDVAFTPQGDACRFVQMISTDTEEETL